MNKNLKKDADLSVKVLNSEALSDHQWVTLTATFTDNSRPIKRKKFFTLDQKKLRRSALRILQEFAKNELEFNLQRTI